MIEAISTHIMHLLETNATTLKAGGNAYAAGWSGVKREDSGDTPTAEYVNLYDKEHDPDGTNHRPGIYLGTRGLEASDGREFDMQSHLGRVELRLLQIPLVICAQAATKTLAKRQRNQLRSNVRKILQGYPVESGYWYGMETSVSTNPNDNKVFTTATGAGSQQVAEGMAILWVTVRYSWTPSCDA